MSAPPTPALDVIALELVAALQRYERSADDMLRRWPDMQYYSETSEEIERVRVLCGMLPQLSVQWVELLIAHSELVHSLWSSSYGSAGREEPVRAECAARHADCLAALRARLRRRYLRSWGVLSGGLG